MSVYTIEDEDVPIQLKYPLRTSELLISGKLDKLTADINPIKINNDDWIEVLDFEGDLFKSFSKIEKIKIKEHAIYPEAFTTDKGRRFFSAIYFDMYLGRRIAKLAKEFEIERTDKNKLFVKFVKDLERIASSRKLYNEYRTTGLYLYRFSSSYAFIKRRSVNKRIRIVIKGRVGRLVGDELSDVIEAFNNVDLRKIAEPFRERMHTYSRENAKSIFLLNFRSYGGNVANISNPLRHVKPIDKHKLMRKIESLVQFRSRLSNSKSGMGDKSQAIKHILNIYKIYTDYHLAECFCKGKVDGSTKNDLLYYKQMQSLDRFLEGVCGEGGVSIPNNIERYIDDNAHVTASKSSKEYNNEYIGVKQMKSIIKLIVKEYGWSNGKHKIYGSVVGRKNTLAVSWEMEKEGVRGRVKIPRNYKTNIVDALTVAAHEVEGHLLRIINQFNLTNRRTLRITSRIKAPRGSALSEAAAMQIEDITKRIIIGEKKSAHPYYYMCLQTKKRGGTFKHCFKTFFKAYVQREKGMSLASSLSNKEAFNEIADYVYSRVMRVFRYNTPLADESGCLTSTSQLKYLEQEIIREHVFSNGDSLKLNKLMYVEGVDLHILPHLLSLGMIDTSAVNLPRKVVAKKIWPIIKEEMDRGGSAVEAVNKLNSL
jgi:hypothetical protein